MQAHKLSGKINDDGQLIVTEMINLPPGEVEVIVLQTSASPTPTVAKSIEYKTKTFRDLLENAQPVPEDFDADDARWEALKEKHNL